MGRSAQAPSGQAKAVPRRRSLIARGAEPRVEQPRGRRLDERALSDRVDGGTRTIGRFEKSTPPATPSAPPVDAPEVAERFLDAGPTEQARTWPELGAALEQGASDEQDAYVGGVELGRLDAPAGRPVETAPSGFSMAVPTLPSVEKSLPPPPPPSLSVGSTDLDAGTTVVGDCYVVTSEGETIPTTPGPVHELPLTGSTDPSRMDDAVANASDAIASSAAGMEEALLAVPGIESVGVPELDHPVVMEAVEGFDLPDTEPIPEMEAFLALELEPELLAAYDEDFGEQYRATLDSGLYGPLVDERSKRDAERERLLSDADLEQEAILADANADTDAAMTDAQADIEKHQADARKKQRDAIDAKQAELDARHAADIASLGQRAREDQARIDSEYEKARKTSEDQIADGEKQVDQARDSYEEQKENPPDLWTTIWNSITDFFEAIFSFLLDIINFVFDMIRMVIEAVFNALAFLVQTINDAFVSFATGLLDAFGDFVKDFIVGELIGSIFPDIVDDLCWLVDGAIGIAKDIVKGVNDAITDAVVGVIEGVRDGLIAYASFYEMYISTIVGGALFLTTGDWKTFLANTIQSALRIAGIPDEVIDEFIGKVEETIEMLVADPVGFIENVVESVAGGLEQFGENFLDHFTSGFLEWLTGELGDIAIPSELSLEGIFDIVLQVLDLTPDDLRQKAVDRIGEDAVEAIEFVWGFIEAGLNGGLEGLIEHMEGKLDELVDMVIGGISNWIIQTIVTEVALKVASSSTGIGGIVQALITAYDFYLFLRDDMQRIIGIIMAVVDMMNDIAKGSTQGASDLIEQVLGNMIPVAISMLAQLLHIDGISDTVRSIIEELRGLVDDAIDTLIDTVLGWFGAGDGGEDVPEEMTAEQALSALEDVVAEMRTATEGKDTDDGHCRDLLAKWAEACKVAQGAGADNDAVANTFDAAVGLTEWLLTLDEQVAASMAEKLDGDATMEAVEIWIGDGEDAQRIGVDLDLGSVQTIGGRGIVLLGLELIGVGIGSTAVQAMGEMLQETLVQVQRGQQLGIDTDDVTAQLQPSAQILVDQMGPELLSKTTDSEETRQARQTAAAICKQGCMVLGLVEPPQLSQITVSAADLPQSDSGPGEAASGESDVPSDASTDKDSFSAGEETHSVWLEADGTAMVASTPSEVKKLNSKMSGSTWKLPESVRQEVVDLLIEQNTVLEHIRQAVEQGADQTVRDQHNAELAEVTRKLLTIYFDKVPDIMFGLVTYNEFSLGLKTLLQFQYDHTTLGTRVLEYYAGFTYAAEKSEGGLSVQDRDAVAATAKELIDRTKQEIDGLMGIEFVAADPGLSAAIAKPQAELAKVEGKLMAALGGPLAAQPLGKPTETSWYQGDITNVATAVETTSVGYSEDIETTGPPKEDPPSTATSAPPEQEPADPTPPEAPPAADLSIDVDIEFEKNQREPRSDQMGLLPPLKAEAADEPLRVFTITGYASKSGEPEYNQGISEDRAEYVANAMALGGGDPRAVVTGVGEKEQATGDHARRVEVRTVSVYEG